MTEKVVIIGSGPASWAAAIYTARAELKPLVFEGANNLANQIAGTLPLGQLNLTTEVENYPGFPSGDMETYLNTSITPAIREFMAPHHKKGVSGPELMELMRQQAVNFGTRVITDDIVDVDFSSHPFTVKPSEGEAVKALAVIIATGARANYLGLPSEEKYKNKGVSGCAVCDGGLPRFKNRPLIVVGGGDSAVEEAMYLTKFGTKVHLIVRRDKLRASKIMAHRAETNSKIVFEWNTEVVEVLGDSTQGVTGVKLQSTVDGSIRELPCSGMFLGIGHTPNTTFLKGKIDLKDNGYVKLTVPFRTNTSVEGVFAAGDVADDYYRQAITAAGTGCQAALDVEKWLTHKGFE